MRKMGMKTKDKRKGWNHSSAFLIGVLVLLTFGTVLATSCFYTLVNEGIQLPGLYNDNNFWESLFVNFHCIVIDMVLFTLILKKFNKKDEKEEYVKKYQTDIDDCREIYNEYATFKLVPAIKRLNEINIYKFKLTRCWFKRAYLNECKILQSDLMGCHISDGSIFKGSEMRECDFKGAEMTNSDFSNCDFSSSKMHKVKCKSSSFKSSKMINCHLGYADFTECDLRSVNLSKSNLEGVIFENANLQDANLKDVECLDIDKLVKCKTLYKAKLDKEIVEKIAKKYPQKIEDLKINIYECTNPDTRK